VINLLADNNNYLPDNGDIVRMNIVFGNRYPVAATGVKCSLSVNNSHIQITSDTSRLIDLLFPDSSKLDTNIQYQISGGYREDTSGIIPATLFITGSNIMRDSIPIDLNPIRNATLKIDPNAVVTDFKGGVNISWSPDKYSSLYGRRSDFLGYVVLRKTYGSSDDSSTLLTPWAITAGNYFYDNVPQDTNPFKKYTYTVAMVDSAYNFCTKDTIDVLSPWSNSLRNGFPIYISGFSSNSPIVADWNKNGIASVYTITPQEAQFDSIGRAVGFRPDGQEAIVSGKNDGIVYDHHASNIAWADLDGDGQDEAIFTSGNDLIVRNFSDTSKSWKYPLDTGHSKTLAWYCRPVISDVDGDNRLEVILYGMDNLWSGHQRSTSLYVFKSDVNGQGSLLARNDFHDNGSYQHGIAVGNFISGSTDQQILLSNWGSDSMYMLKGLSTSSHRFQVSSVLIANVLDTVNPINPNSPLSVGQVTGSSQGLDAVINICQRVGANPIDTLKVYSISNSDGSISTTPVAWAVIPIKLYSFWTGAPALADMNHDGKHEIVFATDDTIYVFKYGNFNDTLIHALKIPFGSVLSNRSDESAPMPQPLVVSIGNTDTSQIIINHCGDGNVWAFNVWYDGANYHWNKRDGFPLKVHGKVTNACAVTDLEGDDTLDLVAVDQGGYMYAWKLGKGSVYKQEWPYDFGNVWGTGYNGNKPSGNVGYVWEDWSAAKAAPYKWQEYDSLNSVNSVDPSSGQFTRVDTSLFVKTNVAGDRNMFFQGPNMKVIKNYTIQGKIKFDDASAEFGIDFYAQWPNSSRKYSLIRSADGLARLYYYSDSSTRTMLGTPLDTAIRNGGAGNSALLNTAHWYYYEIISTNDNPIAGQTLIKVKIWVDSGTVTKPASPGITANPAQNLTGGLVGIVTSTGNGYRYWGPMKVISSQSSTGAYLAYENFKEDTIVDVKPYTPAAIHPIYSVNQFTVGTDTTGFVFDKTGGVPSLIYRHRPGMVYPVTCQVAPYTNLDWRDYTFADTIIKPVGSVYDSIDLYIPFYYTDSSHTYQLGFTQNGVVLNGGGFHDSVLVATKISGGDTLSFSIAATTNPLGGVPDGDVSIIIASWKNGTNILPYKQYVDDTPNNIKSGYACLRIDLSNISNLDNRNLLPIRFRSATVQKIVKQN
jgi:hypothetical protein